jgi:hypothetical protein
MYVNMALLVLVPGFKKNLVERRFSGPANNHPSLLPILASHPIPEGSGENRYESVSTGHHCMSAGCISMDLITEIVIAET